MVLPNLSLVFLLESNLVGTAAEGVLGSGPDMGFYVP